MPHREPAPDLMSSLRRLVFEAGQSSRYDELMGGMEGARPLEEPGGGDPARVPAGKKACYGCVIIDKEHRRVYLRSLRRGERNIYGWTFSKGIVRTKSRGESCMLLDSVFVTVEDTIPATREDLVLQNAVDQFGVKVRLLAPIPAWFVGKEYALWYWVAEVDDGTSLRDMENRWRFSCRDEIKWFTWEEAVGAIQENPTKGADLLILEAARKLVCEV